MYTDACAVNRLASENMAIPPKQAIRVVRATANGGGATGKRPTMGP